MIKIKEIRKTGIYAVIFENGTANTWINTNLGLAPYISSSKIYGKEIKNMRNFEERDYYFEGSNLILQ